MGKNLYLFHARRHGGVIGLAVDRFPERINPCRGGFALDLDGFRHPGLVQLVFGKPERVPSRIEIADIDPVRRGYSSSWPTSSVRVLCLHVA